MRILVTGAAGFIGSHVAEAYHKASHKVLGIDNLSTGRRENLLAEIPLETVDLADRDRLEALFKTFQPEAISHHAAQVNVRLSWERPTCDAQANILGSLHILELATRARTGKIIYSSSGGAIYGEPKNLPVREDYPPRPLSNYGVSKYTVELYLQALRTAGGPNYVILRYPNVHGPRQDPSCEAGVVAIFATKMLRQERPKIFGDGTKTRDYVYIDDIVDANLRALQYSDAGVFNLGWGREVSDVEVFDAVREAVGCGARPIFEKKRPGEIDHICLDASRASQLLGWQPRISFREGVEKTVQHWKKKLGHV